MNFEMLNYFIYLETHQSIHKVRSKLKDISRILKDIGALLGKDNDSLDVRISHPGNATEASFEIERMKNKISVNVVQPLGEVEDIDNQRSFKYQCESQARYWPMAMNMMMMVK